MPAGPGAANISMPRLKSRRSAARNVVAASSLRRALNIIGDVWTMLLLREFFSGQHRFLDLQSRLQIPRQTLLLRLTALTQHECLYRKPVPRSTRQYEYHLTPKGLDLYPFVLSVWNWHRRWDHKFSFLPANLIHKNCHRALDPELRCDSCDQRVLRNDVQFFPGSGSGLDARPPTRLPRQNELAQMKTAADGGTALVAASIFGDRWSYLILAHMFHGIATFSALGQELRISSNILSARLKKLIALELIEADPERAGRRIEYRFTNRGEDLFAMMQSVSRWGDRWLAGIAGPPEIAKHSCGAVMDVRYACRHCGKTVRPWDVEVARTAVKK
jgi:DNA-binding HxlR family transcriptional regulator